jgi:hypothetical protein
MREAAGAARRWGSCWTARSVAIQSSLAETDEKPTPVTDDWIDAGLMLD